jgi:AraC family transcriptional regulator
VNDFAPIADALAFVEAHLQAPIAVADMADAAGYSLYHFCRVFNTATHHTPYSYMIRRRLAEAVRALVTTDARVIDIALDYQFNNPETFTRACRRIFDASPSQLRDAGALDPHRLMPALTVAHLDYLAGNRDNLQPVYVKRQPLHLAGLMTWGTGESAACPELWDRMKLLLKAFDPLLTMNERYGLRWYPPGWTRDGVCYLAAVRLPDANVDLSGTPFVRKTLPAGPYVHFRHRGAAETLPLMFDYVYHTWLANAERTLGAPFVLACCDDEERTFFFPLSRAPAGMSGESDT